MSPRCGTSIQNRRDAERYTLQFDGNFYDFTIHSSVSCRFSPTSASFARNSVYAGGHFFDVSLLSVIDSVHVIKLFVIPRSVNIIHRHRLAGGSGIFASFEFCAF
jgi:hypothetical protein